MTTTTLKPAGRHTSAQHPVVSFIVNRGVYVVVALLILVGCAGFREKFWSTENLVATILAVGLLGIVAVGVAFVTYSGHYADLSVPGIMAFSGIIAVSALPYGIVASLLAGLFAGLVIGLVNGIAVGQLRVNPIIWTLAMGFMVNGMILWLFSGRQIYPDESTAAGKLFLGMYSAQLFNLSSHSPGIPAIILLLAVMVLLGSFVMFGTRFGAQLKLIGSSYEVARATGVNARRLIATAFLISAFTSAIGGILLTSLNKVGAAYIGAGYDFRAITAIVVGGVTLAGGRGSILGMFGGVLVIGLLQNILSLQGVGTFTQDIIQGIVFILVVGAQAYYLRRAGRDDA
ncbi:MAG: ABC transporter permease [Armatimonadota bacterium]